VTLPPLTAEQAAWIRDTVHRPRTGRASLQPHYMGQTVCLHLATPECTLCRGGHHGSCTGTSWPRLDETEIRDSHGSSLFWAAGSCYRVWTSPRDCACACRTVPAPAPPEPRRAPAEPPLPVASAPAAPVMPGWEQPALPL
jgi:hypothetical protein